MNLFKMKCVLVLVCIFISFNACSDEDPDSGFLKNESPYDRMGRLHNEGLDYVLEKIGSTSPLTKVGGKVIPEMSEIRRMCCDFAHSKGYQIVTKGGLSELDTLEDFSFLSENQQKWLEKVKKTVGELTPESVEKFTIVMKSLECQLEQDEEISETEKEVLFYTMAVSRYSARYWINNYEKWQIELYGINKKSNRKIRTRSEDDYYVTKEWWETYKRIVWGDGSSGILQSDGYYLVDATVGSVYERLN